MKKKILKKSLFIASSLVALLVSTSAIIIKNVNDNVKNSQVKDVTKILLTFDANGGTLVGNDKVIEVETTTQFKDITNKPTATKEGVSGNVGWYYLDGTNKVKVNDNTTFSAATTLYADWKLYTVTFDAGDGSFANGDKTKVFNDVTIVHSDELTAPTLTNHTFAGWKVGGVGEHQTFPFKPSGESTAITLKADYVHAETVRLAFSANGGKFSDNKIVKYADVEYGKTWGEIKSLDLLSIEEPTIDSDSLFSKWNINNADISDDTKFTNTTYIKAKYESAISITFNVNANGGTWADGSTIDSIVSPKIKLSTNPSLKSFVESISYTTPKKGNVELLGWFDNKDANGTPLVLESETPLSNTSSFEIYAYYKDSETVTTNLTNVTKTSGPVTYIRKQNLTWTFTGDSGYTLAETNISCSWGNSTKARGTDYTFTVADNVGTLTINDAPKGGITINISSAINQYGISCDTSITGVSSISSDKSAADYNETVKITASASEGYTLGNIKVLNASTLAEYATISSGGTFTMPAYNVKVVPSATINNYTITHDALPTGVANLTVASTANYNETVTVTATASDGYTLGNIKIINAETSAELTTISSGGTFTMPAYNVKVVPSATINSYTLTLDANGGTVNPSSLSVTYNTKLTEAISASSITISHDDAAFKGWGIDTSTLLTDETMPASDKTVYAIYYKYNFLFIDGDHGQVSGTTSYDNKYKLSKSDFSSLVVTSDEGYSFTGEYDVFVGDSSTKLLTTNFDSTLKPGKLDSPIKEDATIKIKPLFLINSYKASFNYNGGLIKKNGSSINSINIPYGDNILSNLSDVVVTHEYASFLNWEMTKQDGTSVTITNETTMPAGYVTLKPIWKTCNITLSGENCTVDTSTLSNKLIVYDREGFNITPTSGYNLDHYEYSFDGTDWTKVSSMPFKPFAIKTDLENDATVYLKAVCVTHIELYLYANGGLFSDGNNFKVIDVIKGNKWGDIKDTLEKPTMAGSSFLKWVNYETGADISDDTVVDSSFVLKAIYS